VRSPHHLLEAHQLEPLAIEDDTSLVRIENLKAWHLKDEALTITCRA